MKGPLEYCGPGAHGEDAFSWRGREWDKRWWVRWRRTVDLRPYEHAVVAAYLQRMSEVNRLVDAGVQDPHTLKAAGFGAAKGHAIGLRGEIAVALLLGQRLQRWSRAQRARKEPGDIHLRYPDGKREWAEVKTDSRGKGVPRAIWYRRQQKPKCDLMILCATGRHDFLHDPVHVMGWAARAQWEPAIEERPTRNGGTQWSVALSPQVFHRIETLEADFIQNRRIG